MNRKLNNKIWLKGLVMECPHGAPARNCPMAELRAKRSTDANGCVDSMDDQEVSDTLQFHRSCYIHRMQEWGDPVC